MKRKILRIIRGILFLSSPTIFFVFVKRFWMDAILDMTPLVIPIIVVLACMVCCGIDCLIGYERGGETWLEDFHTFSH